MRAVEVAHLRRTRHFALALAGALVLSTALTGAADAQAKTGKKKAKKAQLQAMTPSGPTLKYEQFRRTVEIKVAAKREEQISGIKRLLELGAPEDEVPELKFRLAELYYEKSQFYFFRSEEAHDASIRAKTDKEKAGHDASNRKLTRESQTWVKRAMDIYSEIREKYPKYPRMPEVLFALGQTFWNSKRYQESIDVYTDLIRHFADSPLVADAWLAFGEFYFNEGALHRALKSYEFAAKDKRSRVYGFALYKQAWCYYNLSQWQQALDKFRATVFYSQMADELSGENRISLAREAQNDFVKAYAHVGDPNKARFVLADLANEDECTDEFCRKLLEKLGNAWVEQGQFEDAAVIFRHLIKADVKNTRNPYFQGKIVDLISRSGDKPRVIEECRRLVKAYEGVKSTVEQDTGASEAAERGRRNIQDAKVLAESTIRRLAQLWNREAKKTRQKKTYGHALTLYGDYLKLFGDSKYAYQMRFQLGDLYYKLERFDEAAKAYEQTVRADPKGKFAIDAAHDNILAVEEHLKDLRLPRPKSGNHQVDIHEQRRRLIDACDRYVKYVPVDKAKNLVSIKFKSAKVFYDHNHFAEALRRFDEIVTQHPSADQAEFAANLVIDVYNLKEDWGKLYEASARYAKQSALVEGREKLAGDLEKFGQYAKFKLVTIIQNRVEKEGSDLGQVAKAYEEFQSEYPRSENADKALFNASVVWDELGESERADGLRRRLLQEYKDSPLRADVAHYVARSFEEQARYRKAADLFASFSRKYPEDSRARDAMFNAAVFYAGIGSVRKATELREEYLKRYGKQAGGEREAASIYFSIAKDLEAAGNLSKAVKRYDEFGRKFGGDDNAFEALWRQAGLYRKLGRSRRAEKVEKTLLNTYRARTKKRIKMPPAAADYASRIAFGLVDSDFEKYRRLKITKVNLRNPKRFKRSLEDKARAREKMIKAYTGIVTEYQQAWSSVASLYMIAVSWDAFVESLLKVGCPKSLTTDQCTFFKEGLEEQIGPARDSAYKAYLNCVQKSNALNTFTPFSTKCVKALEQLAPDRYPPIEERRMEYSRPRDQLDVPSEGMILKPGRAQPKAPPKQARAGTP